MAKSVEQALDELSKLGCLTTPVATIVGEAVVSFDEKRLVTLLGAADAT